MTRRLLPVLAFGLLVAAPGLAAQEGELPLADVTIHYERVGNGPPLILIHGWSMDLRSWDYQLPALAESFTVLRYDRRGWGGSGGHPDVSRDPVDLDRLMSELGVDPAFVLGHSQGAEVALRFALAYPERVRALVLYGGPLLEGFGLPWNGPDTLPSDMPSIVRDGGIDSLGAIVFSHPLARGFEEGAPETELVERIWETNAGRDLRDPRPPSGATPPPHVDRLVEVDAPTLVVTGELEMPYFQVVAEALAYGIRGAERVTLEGGGHAVHMQQPERFNRVVARFLLESGR